MIKPKPLDKKILVVCPSHNRAGNANRLSSSFRAKSSGFSDLVFVVEQGESAEYESRVFNNMIIEALPGVRGMARPLNEVARMFCNRYLAIMFVGDDHVFKSTGWDKDFVKSLEHSALVYGNDLFQGKALPTACAMRSDVIKALGGMVLEGLRHLYIDNYWLELGKVFGIHYLDYVTIEHLHPAAGKGNDDAEYAAVNSGEMYEHDRKVFEAWRDGEGLRQDEWRYKVWKENQI